jgi:hypothetical protein
MSKWLKKSVFVLITVLSFGLITPPQALLVDKVEAEQPGEREVCLEVQSTLLTEPLISCEEKNTLSVKQKKVKQILEVAQDQAFIKFGERIKPVIEDEFREAILPSIETAISIVTEQYPEEEFLNLSVSEVPGKGKSEKIFHVINQKTGEDVIRFHVRRDHPPQQGYWFNFHYHTYHDQFQTHYDLGTIYWAKNTPPNWMN